MKNIMTSAIALAAIFTLEMNQPVEARRGGYGGGHRSVERDAGDRGNESNAGEAAASGADRSTATPQSAAPEDRSHTLENNALRNDNGWGADDGWTGTGGCGFDTNGNPLPCPSTTN